MMTHATHHHLREVLKIEGATVVGTGKGFPMRETGGRMVDLTGSVIRQTDEIWAIAGIHWICRLTDTGRHEEIQDMVMVSGAWSTH
jgi:hypothetical protein